MWPVAAPLMVRMHGYIRGTAAVRIYPYPALIDKDYKAVVRILDMY